ncbi:MAG TPA: GNAT family N-acetyltransferase [Candidatus Binatia bacterium]|nr:GNAT family N-acetyltransferase [Candidatus Binatia bacterium]
MRIVQYAEIPNDHDLRRQWNRLVHRVSSPEVFLTFEWAQAVQASYHEQLKPLLILAYDGEELEGVASLAINRKDDAIEFLAGATADYCDFLSTPAAHEEFVAAVFAQLAQIKPSAVKLANLPQDSPTAAAIAAVANRNGFHAHLRPAYSCAQVQLGEGEERDRLKSSLAGKKKLRQCLRNMEREGPVCFHHLRTRAEICAKLPAFAEAHVARFQATQRVSSLASPERRKFLEELVLRLEPSVVTLSILEIDRRPVAWNFGFNFCGSWFWYMPTFDSAQEASSPGYCLLSRIVTDACDMPEMKTVDMGLGAEGYKERFGNHSRHTLYAAFSRSRVRHAAGVARYRLAETVKKSPPVEAAVRKVLSAFR